MFLVCVVDCEAKHSVCAVFQLNWSSNDNFLVSSGIFFSSPFVYGNARCGSRPVGGHNRCVRACRIISQLITGPIKAIRYLRPMVVISTITIRDISHMSSSSVPIEFYFLVRGSARATSLLVCALCNSFTCYTHAEAIIQRNRYRASGEILRSFRNFT